MFLAGRVSVKGRKKALSFYSPAASRDEEELFRELGRVMEVLDNRESGRAVAMLADLLKKNQDFGPAQFHLERLKDGEPPLFDDEGKHYWPLDKK